MALLRKMDRFLVDYFKSSTGALLVTGARQTGKTYSVRAFGKAHFGSFIEINFVERPDAKGIFSGSSSAADILLRLSAFVTVPLIKGETLIFFDEVQECPEAVTAIKFLVEEGSYRYILSGSLLGVSLRDLRSQPVGSMGIKELFPLDFEEFILNIGLQAGVLGHVRDAFHGRVAVDDTVHRKLMEAFRLYLVTGGMPAAVARYLESNNLREVLLVQQNILQLYKRDIGQYAPERKLNLSAIFELIPAELNAKNKRFILKNLNEHAKFKTYRDDFLWLTEAGVVLPVYNLEEPTQPLLLARSRNLFKLFQNDVGLLCAQYGGGLQFKILSGDTHLNYGAVFENFVAQELAAHNVTPYYFNSKRQGEVDFVVSLDGRVLPIEVKSGKDYAVHRALNNILSNPQYDIPSALVLSHENLREDGKVSYLPIYMTMFLGETTELPERYHIDLSF